MPRAAGDAAKLLAIWVMCVTPALFADSKQYTWSLLIFVAPLTLTIRELHRAHALRAILLPFFRALLLLIPMGAVLTIGLADDFFIYPEASATLGLTIPAMDLDGVDPAFRIPIEELAFYVLGFSALLMLYAWADFALFPSLRPLRRGPPASVLHYAVSCGAGLALVAAGWSLKQVFNPGDALPGYWTYLMLVPTPLMVAVGPAIASRINWPALALVCLALWGHSVVWEVTLALPQGWWGYQSTAMLGLKVTAWHNLPIEAVVVWLMTPLATVITFEALRARRPSTEATR